MIDVGGRLSGVVIVLSVSGLKLVSCVWIMLMSVVLVFYGCVYVVGILSVGVMWVLGCSVCR